MVSQSIWIAIVIGVFFIGIGASYAHFANTYDPMSMKFQNQELFDQMMTNNPKMSQMWMDSGMMNPQQMMNDPQMQQQMMDMMLTDSDTMQEMILSTMQDFDQIQMIEDMMADMMDRMQNDPELKQAMMEHMDRMKASRDTMMGADNTMMNGMINSNMEKIITELYNKDLNPSQVEYSNIVGFNDLHIEAIRHLAPHGDDSKLDVIVHHHCKVYDDMTVTCLLFPTGMGDQDKPYGMEYIITSEQFQELSDDEKNYWHYHLTEIPRAQAAFPDLTDEELAPLQPIVDETYGKVFYFWNTDDKYPIGEPTVLTIQDLPE